MPLNHKRRIEKIELSLNPHKSRLGKFPDGQGGFIEVPSHLTLIDIMAMCMVTDTDGKSDETERN